jgi:pimeloyl-ACP methyl ester carboxylesterase
MPTHFTHTSGHILPIDDGRLYVELAGNPDGPTLVLLHGGLGDLTDFNGLLDLLPAQFRFLGIDLRGHGRSTLGNGSLTYQRHQADVEAVLTHLGVDAYSVLGFSDGGITAYRLAAQPWAHIRALVTVGAQWRLDPDDPVFTMLAGMTAGMWMEMFPASVAAYTAVNPEPNFETLVQAVVRLWTDTSASGYPGSIVSRIEAPTLLVRGDADPLFALDEAAALRNQIPRASLLNLPFVGHEVHKEAPELLLSTVNDFLLHPEKAGSQPS